MAIFILCDENPKFLVTMIKCNYYNFEVEFTEIFVIQQGNRRGMGFTL